MNKLCIIGLPRTGTTSIIVALLDHYKVAHTCYTKHAFELADVISDCPCLSDYRQLDALFPQSKFIYLQRRLDKWLPSIKMLLNKILPSLNSDTYVNPILKRSFGQIFDLNNVADPLEDSHLKTCYERHKQGVIDYFYGRDNILNTDINQADSLSHLLDFLHIQYSGDTLFSHFNIGKLVDNWSDIKNIRKINSHSAGKQDRQFFDDYR